MTRRQKTSVTPSSRIGELLADGRRTILACALVVVMAVMWIRVLIGHKPASAGAAPAQNPTTQTESDKPNVKVRMVDVPTIPGRNDSIYSDCFKMQDRAPFRQSATAQNPGTDPEVHVVSPNHDQEVIQQVAQMLKLEAVLRNGHPLAFLNDRLLGVGDTFTVERGTSVLEFEVLRIGEDAVLVECNDIQLTLQLAQSMDVRK
jgi:hypothetical protein